MLSLEKNEEISSIELHLLFYSTEASGERVYNENSL